jgi:hypothetical protein
LYLPETTKRPHIILHPPYDTLIQRQFAWRDGFWDDGWRMFISRHLIAKDAEALNAS